MAPCVVLVCAHTCVCYERAPTLASSQWEKPCQFSSLFQRAQLAIFPQMMVSRSSRVLSLSNRIERDLIDSVIRFQKIHIYVRLEPLHVCGYNCAGREESRFMWVRLVSKRNKISNSSILKRPTNSHVSSVYLNESRLKDYCELQA